MPNVSNIENLGDDYENKIPHFDIYDSRNWENLNNNSNYIVIKKEPIKEMNLNFSNDKYLRYFSYVNY